jgi:hypothetical protein
LKIPEVIRICKSKKDRHHNGEKRRTDNTMAKRRTNNDPQIKLKIEKHKNGVDTGAPKG